MGYGKTSPGLCVSNPGFFMPEVAIPKPRAVLFVDGANAYRRFKDVDIDANRFDLRVVARDLAGPARQVVGVRYYDGLVKREGDERIFRQQQRQLASLAKQGVTVRMGRVEPRTKRNELAERLLRFLAVPRAGAERLPDAVRKELYALANTHRETLYWVQKAVDTLLVSDLSRMAADDEYDVAYLMSLDGDMTPGIEFARSRGKTVFVVGPVAPNNQIQQACNGFIVLDEAKLSACYLPD